MTGSFDGRLAVPPHLRERQVLASDPDRSIWVSANAGSGKTHVLTQRVIRLLLTGVAPSRILCLTFTKAAAAEMAQRVFATLAQWSTLEDAALREAIAETGAPAPGPQELTLARRLFTRALETPGGLKIQTIHAFCERLLHLFPFEANVPARFEVADDAQAAEMMAQAKRAMAARAQNEGGRLGAQLALVADLVGSTGVDAVLKEAIGRRSGTWRLASDPQAGLARRLGADRSISAAAVRRAMVEEGLDPARWLALATALEGGAKTDGKRGSGLRVAAQLHREGAEAGHVLSAYWPVFFKADGQPRAAVGTKSFARAHPDFAADLDTETLRLVALERDLKRAQTVERTDALVALADAVRSIYAEAKATAGLLDFDDLIERTMALLERCNSGWVLHKLDAGIDHVLVDEAQDTSEEQWRILERLTDEFASGHGARTGSRSFFVVGDDKQSIFSFQGAAPLMFDMKRTAFERRFKAADLSFDRVPLTTSFRSVPAILDTVDSIYALEAHQDGLVGRPDLWPRHDSIKSRLPGLVEVWPTVVPVSPTDPSEWSIPVDLARESSPPAVLADRVATKIRSLIAADSAERVHDGRGHVARPIRPGDILVLVRTRGSFFEAVIRALKNQRIPVAGADRLDVARHIAVLDLIAAGRVALLPEDDLGLACLLKSPLFGLDDDDLIALAPHRAGSLFDALRASSDPRHRSAVASLERWVGRASAATPFAFYIEILGRDGGRRLMEARLGIEAHDAIDEFLRLALAHERRKAPSLGIFLDEVEALETTVKRDMEGSGDMVRVMTVHAAKGLEAKVVFLPDTCAVPAASHDPVVFDLNKDSALPPLLAWSPRKEDDVGTVADARARERRDTMREYRRLLYVALTRAEERLYIAGFRGARDPQPDCWNAMIAAAFPDAVEVPAFWGGGELVKRIATAGNDEGARDPRRSGIWPTEQASLSLAPSWLRQEAARPTASPDKVRPSMASPPPERLATLRPSRGAATRTGIQTLAARRGTLIHGLLQHLPGVPPSARQAAGAGWLAAHAGADRHDDNQALLAEALAVIASPALTCLFGDGARAEVAVRGRLPLAAGGAYDVGGVVDRLVVTDDAVILGDFKTGTPEAEPPVAYRNQLALYRRVLSSLWPNRPVQALLVWTRGPRVLRFDPSDLEEALDALGIAPSASSPHADS